MRKTIEPPIHSFCWSELAAKNSDVARKFYAGLLGWTYQEEEMPEGMGSYISIFANNMPVGAMFAMTHEAFDGVPPHWGSYVRVANCEASLKKAEELSAIVLKPTFDVMDAGRMAVIKDPSGAVIHLWEKKNHAGAAVQKNVAGTCCWNELMVSEPKVALDFYTKLFDWVYQASEFGGQTYYSLNHADGTHIGGLMAIPAKMKMPPSWTLYFTVTDLEKAMAYVTKNGGRVHFGPHDVHGMGRFAACQDAEGAQFSVFQYKA
jgi:predicted enzyme related to lactoylglutathione lyase